MIPTIDTDEYRRTFHSSRALWRPRNFALISTPFLYRIQSTDPSKSGDGCEGSFPIKPNPPRRETTQARTSMIRQISDERARARKDPSCATKPVCTRIQSSQQQQYAYHTPDCGGHTRLHLLSRVLVESLTRRERFEAARLIALESSP